MTKIRDTNNYTTWLMRVPPEDADLMDRVKQMIRDGILQAGYPVPHITPAYVVRHLMRLYAAGKLDEAKED